MVIYHKGRWNRYVVDGAKLTDARIAAQKSLGQVAQYLGCNKSSVSRWEQGTLVPSEDRIFKMAKWFKTQEFIVENPNQLKKKYRPRSPKYAATVKHTEAQREKWRNRYWKQKQKM